MIERRDVFQAIADPTRKITNGKVEDWPDRHVATVTFESIGQRTKMTIHQTVSEEKAKETGAYQSWIKMFNKLNHLIRQTVQ